MKDRKEVTACLSRLTEDYICPNGDPRIYWAKEVSFNYGTARPVGIEKDTINDGTLPGRVDYMRFKPVNNSISGIEKGDFYCYEIKSCSSDLHSGHGWNFLGDFNYFVMTKELYEKEGDMLSSTFGIGILIPDGDRLTCVRKAHRMDRKYPVSTGLLMMFRSAARDRKRSSKDGADAV